MQGGYAPGYDASNRAMTRDTASTTGRAITGTNLGLVDMIRQGRIAGLGGLSNIGMGSLGIQSGLATQPGWGSSVLQYLEAMMRNPAPSGAAAAD